MKTPGVVLTPITRAKRLPESFLLARRIERALAPHATPERRAGPDWRVRAERAADARRAGADDAARRPAIRAGPSRGTAARDSRRRASRWSAAERVEGRQVGYELIARRPDARALLTARLVERLGHGNDNWAIGRRVRRVPQRSRVARGPRQRRDVLRWARSRRSVVAPDRAGVDRRPERRGRGGDRRSADGHY